MTGNGTNNVVEMNQRFNQAGDLIGGFDQPMGIAIYEDAANHSKSVDGCYHAPEIETTVQPARKSGQHLL